MTFPSDWFIVARVRRLQRLIDHLPARSPGIARHQLVTQLRSRIDGPRREIPALVDVLTQLGYIHVTAAHIQLSRSGHRMATMSAARAARELGQQIIQSGFLHDQVRQLIEASTIECDGSAQSEIRTLRRSAPQLLGLLRAWHDIVGPSFVKVPRDIFVAIDTPWSLVPPVQPADTTNKAIGSRAEAYSVHFLRLGSRRPNSVLWVARDDEGLGYDIEDRSTDELLRIEVKASRRSEVRFFLSRHEHDVAHRNPNNYGVHFWGEINLNRDPRSEFGILRARGFPLVFDNLAAHLSDHRLVAVPTKYRVTIGGDGQ